MTIKHLVISGGGPSLIQALSVVQELERIKFIERNNLESIYGTSAGAILGVLICLKMEWESINDYLVKRPWHELFSIKVQHILDAYTKKGIFDHVIIEKCFKPLFDAMDISMNITLEDFYEYSNIELHLFAFEINQFQIEDISYKSHPKLELMKAIQMTSALPVILTPICVDNKCYIDGGVVCNYPLKYCLENNNVDEVLGIKNKYGFEKNYIHAESTLLDFIMNILFKIIYSLSTDHLQPTIVNEIECNASLMSIDFLKKVLKNMELRKELFKSGIDSVNSFIEKTQNEKVL